MKITSVLKLLVLFVIFYYIVIFVQNNQHENIIYLPWIGEPYQVAGPAAAILGISLAVGFLASAIWLMVKAIINFFSTTGRLGRSMKKVEEKYYYGIEALSKGDDEAAGVFFEEILSLDPENFRTLVKYGELLRRSGKYQKAIGMHMQALTLSQNNVKVLHELSRDHMAAGELDKAKEMLLKILEISPQGNIAIHRQLRELYIKERSWGEALSVQKNILQLVSNKEEKAIEFDWLSGIEFEHAMTLKGGEQTGQAINILQNLAARDPKFLPAHLMLGECYLIIDDEDKAVETWLKGYETTLSPVLLSRLEEFFLGTDQPDNAIEMYNRVISEHQEQLYPKLLQGKLFYRLENIDKAIEIFQDIDSEFEYAPVMSYFMGKIQMRKGNFEEAANVFKEVLRTSGVLDAEYICSVSGDTFKEYVPFSPKAGKWNTVQLNVKKGKSLKDLDISARPIYV